MNARDAIAAAARLEQMGITIRSGELREEAARLREWKAKGGNRAMRRARDRRRSR